MTERSLDRVFELFEQVRELSSAAGDALLAAASDPPEVIERVRAMLRADRRASPLLDAAPDDLAAAASEPRGLEQQYLGRSIGPYTIRRVLGQGGMGIVCLADRADVGKQVALKLVAGGLGSPERVRRFHQERRVLAKLEHPGIARLLDAGVTDEGTPWLAMDYVVGEPIDAFCRSRRLPVELRLGLFERVCAAVGHAHRHLIVHRDIKPSNVMVGEDGEPRLLDFGIAKILADSTDDGIATQTGLGLMTPQYAAPEQLQGEPVTTATDVFQLGALLFEILTDQVPRPRGARGADAAPLPAPSAVARPEGPVPVTRLRGDLDTIVAKATDPDPARRYQGVDQLRDDVTRHLAGLPIVARPATAGYRLKKFVLRHRGGTAAAAVLVVAAVAVAIGFAAEARRTAAERVRAEQVSGLLTEIFAGADPTVVQGESVTVRSVLDRGAERVGANRSLEPVVRAKLLRVIADAYANLGRLDRAAALEADAVTALDRAVARDDPDRLVALRRLARWLADTDARERSFAVADSALAAARAVGPGRRAELAGALNDAGYVRQRAGDYRAARARYEEALAIYRTLPPDLDATATTLVNLGVLADNRGDAPAAQALFQEALDRRQAILGPNHSATARVMLNLTNALLRTGDRRRAESLVQAAVAIQRRVFHGPHPEVVTGLETLARVEAGAGNYGAAETATREALALVRQLSGDRSSAVAGVLANLAGYVQRAGRLDEAARLHREAARLFTEMVGERHQATAVALTNLAWTERLRNRLPESEGLYRRAIPVLDSAWRGTPRLSPTLTDFGIVLSLGGHCDQAEAPLRRAVALSGAAGSRTNVDLLRAKRFLGQCLAKLGRFAAAESLLVDAHRALLEGFGPSNQYTIAAASDLVGLYQRWGRPADAARYQPRGSPR